MKNYPGGISPVKGGVSTLARSGATRRRRRKGTAAVTFQVLVYGRRRQDSASRAILPRGRPRGNSASHAVADKGITRLLASAEVVTTWVERLSHQHQRDLQHHRSSRTPSLISPSRPARWTSKATVRREWTHRTGAPTAMVSNVSMRSQKTWLETRMCPPCVVLPGTGTSTMKVSVIQMMLDFFTCGQKGDTLFLAYLLGESHFSVTMHWTGFSPTSPTNDVRLRLPSINSGCST